MTIKPAVPLTLCAVLTLGACTNPYDPSLTAVGGGLLGAGTLAGAATTPSPPQPQYYPQGYPQGGYSPSPPLAPGAPRDLADIAAGVYHGDVISDARGSSRSGVTIFVAKTGPNTISVTSDYGRLPPFTVRLTRAMHTIQQVGTSVVFLLDLSKGPYGLDITDDDASWSGSRA
jgi:hypothetical protein